MRCQAKVRQGTEQLDHIWRSRGFSTDGYAICKQIPSTPLHDGGVWQLQAKEGSQR
jgi:hypothetical protein